MSAHTPGPWSQELVIHKQITREFSARMITDREGYNIAIGSTWMDNPKTMEEAEANANLIAAAPDLLEALERMVGACNMDSATYLRSCKRDAEIAIARAKGEKP